MSAFDFIILGSGVAGLSFALKVADHGRVLILTKRSKADTNTAWAQGGIAAVWGKDDTTESHVADTLEAGAGLCDEAAVRAIVSEGPTRVQELISLGLQFDEQEVEGGGGREIALGLEGGHSKRRILHFRDTTGRAIEDTLLSAVARHPNIEVREHQMAVDLVTTSKLGSALENRVVGVYVLDEPTGEVLALASRRVVLATGGCGKVYLYTTNPDIATGDGVAMAWRAGASVANMEFIQFHPTCLFHPEAKSFLITEAVRGEGGVLVDANGKSFMEKYHPRASLAPRDIVARAIDAEMKRTGEKCVFLDITHRPADFVRAHFPNIYQRCLALGIDITKQPIPVVPAAHYQCGGVRTDLDGATNVRGLFAIGEVACTGLHGANRLASNSLLEALVLAHRAAARLLHDDPPAAQNESPWTIPAWESGDAHDVDELVVIYHNWDEIRRLMWDYVGIVRTDKRLQRAAARLRNLHAEVQEFYWNFKVTLDLLELRNLVNVAALIVDSALARKESRGLHFTLDYPESNPALARRDTVLRRT